MSGDDRSAYYDAIEDAVPRGVSKAALNTLATAMYDERATEYRCWQILQAEEDAGTVSDAMATASRVMDLFVMGDDGWDLRQPATQVTPPQQVVMLASAQVGPSTQGPQVQRPAAHQGGTAAKEVFRQVGPKGQGPMAQGHTGTLGIDLGGRLRLSKPRSIKTIDEIMWASAQQLSIDEIAVEYDIPNKDTELYYSNMCRVGQQALADAIHCKTQAIYDARCAQQIRRARRKKQSP